MIVKVCKVHGNLTEDMVHKQKNSEIKSGIQLRCAQCRRDKDRKYKLNNPDKYKGTANRKKNEDRRLFREGLIQQEPKANIWCRNHRQKNLESYLHKEAERRKKEGQLRNTKEVCRRMELDVSVYYEMLTKQNNLCAICFESETRKSRTEGKICQLAIDHCHQSGKIRGLLCHACNTAIGKFKDDINLLQKAIEYLKKHQYTG